MATGRQTDEELRLVVVERRWPQPSREEVIVYRGPRFQGFVEGGVMYVDKANRSFSMPDGSDLFYLVSQLPIKGDTRSDGEWINVVYR